jgi:hypothetical protein
MGILFLNKSKSLPYPHSIAGTIPQSGWVKVLIDKKYQLPDPYKFSDGL